MCNTAGRGRQGIEPLGRSPQVKEELYKIEASVSLLVLSEAEDSPIVTCQSQLGEQEQRLGINVLIAVIIWRLGRTEAWAPHGLCMDKGKYQRMLGQRDKRCRKSQRDLGE